MVKEMHILKSHLNAIVCLPGSMIFSSQKAATVSSPTEQTTDQTQRDERVKYAIDDHLRIDGRMDWEMLNIEMHHGHVSLYGEVKTEEQKELATLISIMVPEIVEVTNRINDDEALSKHHYFQKPL